MKQSFKTKLRQLWVPAEFRLPEPEFTKEQLDLLEELIQMITPNLSHVENSTKDDRARMTDFLVDLGTGIWRIRRKIEGLSRMPKEIRDALYSLESMWMSMSDGGVEIVDHIGAIPSPREAQVVGTREIPGLAREQVVDAVKPTILLRGEIMQLGEVIMGKPASSVNSAAYQPNVRPSELSFRKEIEEEEEIPSPVLEVETFTMAPPLKAWNPDNAKTAEEEAIPITANQEPETEEIASPAFEKEPGQPDSSGKTDDEGTLLDSETAAAEEADAREPGEEAEPDIEIPLPKKAPRRRKSTPKADKQPEAAPETETAAEEAIAAIGRGGGVKR